MKNLNAHTLILLLARKSPTGTDMKIAQELVDKGIDWKIFSNVSCMHGLVPVLYRHLSSLHDVPEDVIASFRKTYFFNISDTVRASIELRNIVDVFTANGIDAIPVKGLTSAAEIYGEPSLYSSSDIDILIHEKDIFHSARLMKEMGYTQKTDLDKFLLEKYIELNFYKKGAKHVEIHFCLVSKRYFSFPEDFWWEDLRDFQFDGHIYRILSVEKTILFAGMHLFVHAYSTLKFIVSISEMLRLHEKNIRWQKLMEWANEYNIKRPLLLSLYLAGDLLDAPVPPDVLLSFKKCSVKERWIFKKVKDKVFDGSANLAWIRFLQTALLYNAGGVVFMIMKWIFPPLKEISLRYDIPVTSKKIYLYYILNPFLLIMRKRV